ncbi:MAG: class I SAM-dependent methyltransferase [Lysobacterales bacterium]
MSERKAHWEKIYRDKSPLAVSWYQREPDQSLLLIEKAALALDAPVIDIGGGASTLVDELCDRGHTNISVLDISAAALAHSKIRLGQKRNRVHWYEEDVTLFKPPHRFALWHDRAVFHFLTVRADRERYIDVLKRALEPGGQVIMLTFALDGPVKCSGLEIVQYDADKLSVELGADFELLETGREVHITPTGNQQKFAWFRFINTQKPDK